MGRAFEYRRAAKEKRWANMSRIFPKLSRMITIAAKEGGPDPEMNAKLRTAIANAKAQNMPKDNIESAIKRASGKDAADYVEVNYEGKGPHGVLIFVEAATDNPTRTVANVKLPFSKSGGQLLPSGSLEFLFDRKAVIEFATPEGVDLEELELELIDAGLEEMQSDEESVLIYGDYTAFGSLNTALEEKGYEIKESKLERIANDPKSFSAEELADIEKIIEKLEDDDDVQNVFTNIAQD